MEAKVPGFPGEPPKMSPGNLTLFPPSAHLLVPLPGINPTGSPSGGSPSWAQGRVDKPVDPEGQRGTVQKGQ